MLRKGVLGLQIFHNCIFGFPYTRSTYADTFMSLARDYVRTVGCLLFSSVENYQSENLSNIEYLRFCVIVTSANNIKYILNCIKMSESNELWFLYLFGFFSLRLFPHCYCSI